MASFTPVIASMILSPRLIEYHVLLYLMQIMRVCLSFLVVEYIRQGMSPQMACAKGIERVMSLRPAAKSDQFASSREVEKTMHVKLTVGVIAMDRHGNVRSIGGKDLISL